MSSADVLFLGFGGRLSLKLELTRWARLPDQRALGIDQLAPPPSSGRAVTCHHAWDFSVHCGEPNSGSLAEPFPPDGLFHKLQSIFVSFSEAGFSV